ncbi:MAG: M81 family metallopeptidase [Proteobacteria bacterium]|nr:M81 family metallopeptidase [Pseudomonadota bacterium]MBI3499933.1 M81 family metallopeptidase [Pseudomonadota bacterium]
MPKRVLSAAIMHETNTFSRVKTDMAAFRRRTFYLDNEIPQAFRGTRSAFGATFEAADKYGWTLVHPISASANPAGLVTDAAFESMTKSVLDAILRQGPIDGMLLHLHGAMVTESHEDGEGALLERIRQKVGPDIPIIVTLDLHANVTGAMCRHANALIAFRTYPHIDQYERAWQGADLLERAMRGEIRPKTVLARRPMLEGLDHGRTQGGPMAELLSRADAIETKGDALVVSICAGFTAADIHDVGPTVTVTSNGADPKAEKIAEEFMDYAWAERAYRSIKLLPIPEVIHRARQGKPGDKPLVIADYTDNPGGGGYGDSTAVLKAMVEAGLRGVGFHAICDPDAVLAGQAAGVGKTATIKLGGKVDPAMGGGPVELTGEVGLIADGKYTAWGPMGGGVKRDHGLTMVFRLGGLDGIEIVVVTNNAQATDLAQFTAFGIDPARKQTVFVKSMHHFRAAFQPIAREVILVDSGSLCSENYKEGVYKRVRHPIWPIDKVA